MADGYRLEPLTQSFSAVSLAPASILMVSNALADDNIEDWGLPNPSAFDADEIEALLDWIHDGGALLLIADHQPWPAAAEDLASELGFIFNNGSAGVGGRPNGPDQFSRATGTLVDHPIVRGRFASEAVNSVMTFGGQAFRSLPASDAAALMVFPPQSRMVLLEDPFAQEPPPEKTITIRVDGMMQGAVRTLGRGRVAVFGEAAMFTAQVYGPNRTPMGMNHPEAADNAQFVLNVLHWLSGILPDEVLPDQGAVAPYPEVTAPGQLSGQIVFESARDGHTEIYVMDVDGSNQRRLTYTVGDDRRSSLPDWSPDGRKIAFSTGPDRHMEIYVMDSDGSNVREIWNAEDTQDEAWGAQWSPDGRRIVFVSNSGGNYDIYVMDNTGLNVCRLTHMEGSGKDSEDPVWSPDGEWIVFNSNRDGNWEIYVMRSDGSDIRRLTHTPGRSLGAGKPAWSPDGESILFPWSRGRNSTNWYDAVDIYLMDADGANVRRLTHTGDNGSPIWAPDGQRIAFSSHRSGDSPNWRDNREIYVMNADGSDVQRLTFNGVWDSHPQW